MGCIEAIAGGLGKQLSDLFWSLLDAGAECADDDPQRLIIVVDDPLDFLVAAGDPVFCIRVLAILSSVPADAADIRGIMENAGPSADMAADCCVTPFGAGRALGIEFAGDVVQIGAARIYLLSLIDASTRMRGRNLPKRVFA